MGIPISATLSEVFENHRRRGHRVEYLRAIEEAIETTKLHRKEGRDVSHWKYADDVYKSYFVTKNTWKNIRIAQPEQSWYKGVWFSFATPKYSFLSWLAVHNRLTTGDRMRQWSNGPTIACIFCNNAEETRNHLFFECSVSGEIWHTTISKLLGSEYTVVWHPLVALLTSSRAKKDLFLLRYAFQVTLYNLWRERNQRRHGGIAQTPLALIKIIDKAVKNRINALRIGGNNAFTEVMERWLMTR